MTSRGRELTKLCGDFAVNITSIIMVLITILLMIDDRCNTSFAQKMLAMYIYHLFSIGDENGCKTNSVFYFKYLCIALCQKIY